MTAAPPNTDAQAFASDGYLRLGRVLEPDTMEALRREYAQLFAPDGFRDLAATEGERML